MKKNSKFLIALIIFSLTLNGCGMNQSSMEDINSPSDKIKEIYDKAVAEGKTDLTYEEWLDSIKGSDGKDGESAYEIYKRVYGYEGTEEEWLFDLANGNLNIQQNNITISFNTSGGNTIQPIILKKGDKIKRPADPIKSGYTFDYWEYEGERWSFPGYTATENMTLNAQWIPNKYKVTFNDRGTITQADVIMGEEFSFPNLTPDPGKAFVGWYYNDQKIESNIWNIPNNAELISKFKAVITDTDVEEAFYSKVKKRIDLPKFEIFCTKFEFPYGPNVVNAVITDPIIDYVSFEDSFLKSGWKKLKGKHVYHLNDNVVSFQYDDESPNLCGLDVFYNSEESKSALKEKHKKVSSYNFNDIFPYEEGNVLMYTGYFTLIFTMDFQEYIKHLESKGIDLVKIKEYRYEIVTPGFEFKYDINEAIYNCGDGGLVIPEIIVRSINE